ncbi:glycerol-3-phosphate acyltransferase [Actinomycetota bacterium]
MEIIEILKIIGLIVLCYLIGAIPFCNLLALATRKKDLTKIGDKNPGGWNLVFNVSKIWGIVGILLDMCKGYFSYFLIYMFTGNLIIAILAGCAAVAGHNYSPYLKFHGGKGLATMGGLVIAISPWTLLSFGIGMVSGLFLIRNMIWGVLTGLVTTGIFLWLFIGSSLYLVMTVILILLIIPKYINRSISLGMNFKFRKEKTMKDLFTPKIR